MRFPSNFRTYYLAKIIALCLCASVSTTCLASSKIEDKTTQAINRWTNLCNNLPSVTERSGKLTNQSVREGLSRLQSAGVAGALSLIYQNEACLSLASTAKIKQPSIALIRHADPQFKSRHPNSVSAMPDHYKRVQTARRLAQLNINLAPETPQSDVNGSFQAMQNIDQELAIENTNLGVLAQGGRQERSYAVTGGPVCVVAIEPTPLIDHLRTKKPFIYRHLANRDRDYLEKNGSAIEFWHEVAHCDMREAASQIGKSANSLMGALESRRTPTSSSESCRPAPEQDDTTNTLALFRQAVETTNLLEGSNQISPAQSGAATPRQKPLDGSINEQIRVALLQEALADEYGVWVTREQQGAGVKESCISSTPIGGQGPWQNMRALWSIANPNAHYLTWTLPWLVGTTPETQQQVILEAFHGSFAAAKKYIGEPHYKALVASRARTEFAPMSDPRGAFDKGRADSWSKWLEARLLNGRSIVE